MRTHPVFPFERLKDRLKDFHSLPENVEISKNDSIDDDYAQAGNILYRGSSTVIYAILYGLKPFYFSRPNEMNFDPLYELSAWRENVNSVEDLLIKHDSDKNTPDDVRIREWRKAMAYCDEYMQPICEDSIDDVITLASGKKMFKQQY